MTVGNKIKELRLKKGWTQEELAKKCGYSGKSVISKAEASGDNIGAKKLARIAAALDVSPASFLTWEPKTDSTDKSTLIHIIESANAETLHLLRTYAQFLIKEEGD